MKTVVVDYGMGNLRSVAKALQKVAPTEHVIVTSDAAIVAQADRVVVPGQGAMHDCMQAFNAHGVRDAVMEAIQTKPFLGICVGMQMLFDCSEEGNSRGLGVFAGEVKRFHADMYENGSRLKVPHMGWNEVRFVREHALWQGIEPASRFYFVHSYYCAPGAETSIVAQTQYGAPFTSAVGRDNIFAVQFHPEKSAQAGLQLLANFMQWAP